MLHLSNVCNPSPYTHAYTFHAERELLDNLNWKEICCVPFACKMGLRLYKLQFHLTLKMKETIFPRPPTQKSAPGCSEQTVWEMKVA